MQDTTHLVSEKKIKIKEKLSFLTRKQNGRYPDFPQANKISKRRFEL
jgi:hypothetical protein